MSENLIKVLDIIANISEVLYFLTPIHSFILLYLKKISIKDFPIVLLVFNFYNSFLWELFLRLIDASTFSWVCNLFKTSVSLIFFIIYIYYYVQQKNPYYQIFWGIILLAKGVMFIVLTMIAKKLNVDAILYYAEGVTIGMYVYPLVYLERLFVTNKCNTVPIVWSFVLMLSSLIFVIKYLLQKDYTFLYIDVMGLVANVIVCAIWSVYFFVLKKEPTDDGEGVTSVEPILNEKV